MVFERGVYVLVLGFVMFSIVGLTIWSSKELFPTGFAVSCTDADGDGYYDEECSISCEDEGIITSSYSQQGIEADENYIVYKDNTLGNWDVYVYDLNSGISTQISSSEEADINPDVNSDYVVWQSLINEVWQVYIYDFSTGVSQALSESSSHQVSPIISSEWIVWSDFRNGNWDIYGYADGSEYELLSGEGDQTQTRIYENYLVYVSDSNGNNDVYLYDFATGLSTQISSSSADDVAPDIDGKYVVWQNNEAGNWDIYAYELETGEISIVSEISANEYLPRISENIIVWEANSDIYFYDISEQDSGVLIDDDYKQYTPSIFEGKIYWIDLRSDNEDIYGMTFDGECLSQVGDCDDANNAIYPDAEEICDDYLDNDCNEIIDTDCGVSSANDSCILSDKSSNIWTDESWSANINSASSGETVYMVSYGDGNCGSVSSTFYLYSVAENNGEYFTDELVGSFSGIVENYPDEGYDVAYIDWVSEGEDTYYYFISLLGDSGAVGDSILVCSSTDCNGESISVSDAEDYLANLLGGTELEEELEIECESDEDCETGFVCEENACVAEEEIDCNTQWDCSGASWSTCDNGISTRDLDLCVQPTDEICYGDEYLPESEKACTSTSSSIAAPTESGTETKESESVTTEDVPFFSWFNLLLVLGLLIGYYYLREK